MAGKKKSKTGAHLAQLNKSHPKRDVKYDIGEDSAQEDRESEDHSEASEEPEDMNLEEETGGAAEASSCPSTTAS